MAISVITATTAGTHSAAGTVNLTLNQVPTTGNMLVVGISQFQGSVGNISITDNQTGNIYALAATGSIVSNAVNALFYAKNINSTGTSFVLSFSGLSASGNAEWCYEVAGVDKVAPLDTAGSSVGTSGAAGQGTSVSISNTNANDIFWNTIASRGADTCNAGIGWTIDNTNGRELNGTSFEVGGLDYKIVSATQSLNQIWTINNSTGFVNSMACFKAAVVVGAVPTNFKTLLGVGQI